jgi:hypothetical protein
MHDKSARDFVLEFFSDARAEWIEPAQAGESNSSHSGYWAITRPTRPTALGTGKTREDAWADAADDICRLFNRSDAFAVVQTN